MNVVDSSLWIEYLGDTAAGRVVSEIITNTDGLVVHTIVIYEVYKKLLYEKNKKDAAYIIKQMKLGKVINLSYALSMSAATISKIHKLPMADSIIYATALKYNSVVWTQDEHFAGLPSVNYFEKKK